MVYDSFLWREVIKSNVEISSCADVLELLPGTSITIPVALKSLKFKGTLARQDVTKKYDLSNYFEFNSFWVKKNIFEFKDEVKGKSLIVGNHIVDDLIYFLNTSEQIDRDYFQEKEYVNPDLSLAKWKEIAQKNHYVSSRNKMIELFVEIVQLMDKGSTMILKQYPSTFSLINEDIVSINIQLGIFYDIYRYLKLVPDFECFFFDFDSVPTAPGSKYPNSFLVIRK